MLPTTKKTIDPLLDRAKYVVFCRTSLQDSPGDTNVDWKQQLRTGTVPCFIPSSQPQITQYFDGCAGTTSYLARSVRIPSKENSGNPLKATVYNRIERTERLTKSKLKVNQKKIHKQTHFPLGTCGDIRVFAVLPNQDGRPITQDTYNSWLYELWRFSSLAQKENIPPSERFFPPSSSMETAQEFVKRVGPDKSTCYFRPNINWLQEMDDLNISFRNGRHPLYSVWYFHQMGTKEIIEKREEEFIRSFIHHRCETNISSKEFDDFRVDIRYAISFPDSNNKEVPNGDDLDDPPTKVPRTAKTMFNRSIGYIPHQQRTPTNRRNSNPAMRSTYTRWKDVEELTQHLGDLLASLGWPSSCSRSEKWVKYLNPSFSDFRLHFSSGVRARDLPLFSQITGYSSFSRQYRKRNLFGQLAYFGLGISPRKVATNFTNHPLSEGRFGEKDLKALFAQLDSIEEEFLGNRSYSEVVNQILPNLDDDIPVVIEFQVLHPFVGDNLRDALELSETLMKEIQHRPERFVEVSFGSEVKTWILGVIGFLNGVSFPVLQNSIEEDRKVQYTEEGEVRYNRLPLLLPSQVHYHCIIMDLLRAVFNGIGSGKLLSRYRALYYGTSPTLDDVDAEDEEEENPIHYTSNLTQSTTTNPSTTVARERIITSDGRINLFHSIFHHEHSKLRFDGSTNLVEALRDRISDSNTNRKLDPVSLMKGRLSPSNLIFLWECHRFHCLKILGRHRFLTEPKEKLSAYQEEELRLNSLEELDSDQEAELSLTEKRQIVELLVAEYPEKTQSEAKNFLLHRLGLATFVFPPKLRLITMEELIEGSNGVLRRKNNGIVMEQSTNLRKILKL